MDYRGIYPLARDVMSRMLSEIFQEQGMIETNIGFQSLFGRGGNEFYHPDDDTTDITIKRGNRRTAELGLRGISGEGNGPSHRFLEGDSGTEISRTFPISKPEMVISAKQINRRRPGEPQFSGNVPYDRMRALAKEKQQDNNGRIVRMNERLAAQVVLEGIQDAILDTSDTDQQYDFYRNTGNSISIADGSRWQAAASDPGGDLDDAIDAVKYNGNINPDIAIIGETAWARLIATNYWGAEKLSRNYVIIQGGLNISAPAGYEWMVTAGFDYQGTLKTPKGRTLHLFTYGAVFSTFDWSADTDTNTKYMPVVKVVVMATQARLAKHWGPPDTLAMSPSQRQDMMDLFGFDLNNPDLSGVPNLQAGFPLNGVYYDCYRNVQNEGVVIRAQVAPLFVPVMTDSISVLENAGNDNT